MLLRPSWVPLLYLGGLVAAFELSLGLSGYSYRFLYEHVSIFHGFRAMARLGIFVVFFLAVLAAYGLAAASTTWPRARGALAVAALVVLVFEYRVRPLALIRYPNEAPPLSSMQFDEFQPRQGNLNLIYGTAGVKVNPRGNWLISASVLFLLSDAGLKNRLTTIVGMDYAF